jgi:hypothetical protein
MPDRAIVAMLPAISLGFICGIIASTLQLGSGPTLIVALAGAVAVAIAGTSSVFGCKGEAGERAIVGALRAGCGIGLFLGIFLFMVGFLRDSQGALAFIWLIIAGVFALLLARLRVRVRDEPDGESGGESGATA